MVRVARDRTWQSKILAVKFDIANQFDGGIEDECNSNKSNYGMY